MKIRLMNFKLRDKLQFILFGTNNWDLISRYELINNNNVNVRLLEYGFINNCINKNINLVNTPEYKLYRLAKEISEANIVQLQSLSPDLNLFTLDQVKRNTRSCIEAYLNMIALMNEPLFLSLYNRECRVSYSEKDFNAFLSKYNLDIKEIINYNKRKNKYTYVLPNAKFKAINKILNRLGLSNDRYKYFEKEYKLFNNYSHSNIYANYKDEPETDVKKLLKINLDILKNCLVKYIMWSTDDYEYQNCWRNYTDDLCKQIDIVSSEVEINIVLLYTEIPNYTFG